MERESFEDDEVADLLNRNFVSIKVDREERPDLDHIYMSVCQALTGQGGWPLTLFLTPEKKPFYAGTYFPKRGKWGRIGLMELLERIRDKWESDRDGLVRAGDEIIDAIASPAKKQDVKENRLDGNDQRLTDRELTFETLEAGYQQHLKAFDPDYGGFGGAPKFPTPHHLTFLLRYGRAKKKRGAFKMAEETLTRMAQGGIYDHLGFGFARYSTDKKWLVPHFEKMLYDNALLAYAYIEGYQVTGNGSYRRVAEEIFQYAERRMRSPQGGFYSAEDADSEGVEGMFYLWTREEILAHLGEREGDFFCRYYDVSNNGNFEGKNILNRIDPVIPALEDAPYYDTVTGLKVDREKLEEMREKLFSLREKRIHPHLDDKILTSWNALMIASLAKGGKVFRNRRYIEMAEDAYRFIRQFLVREDGRLLARYREGEAKYPAYLEDHAFLLWGLMELYEATFQTEYLLEAVRLAETTIELFWDQDEGGFFMSGTDGEALLYRPKEIYDGALPSGNSVAAYQLIRLGRMTERFDLAEKGESVLRRFAKEISGYPFAFTMSLQALLFLLQETKEIRFTGRREEDGLPLIGRKLQSLFLPDAVLVYHDEEEAEDLGRRIPGFLPQKSIEGKPTIYLCRNGACQMPTTEIDRVIEELNE